MGENLLISTGAAGQVGNEVDQFQSYGNQAIDAARQALSDMLTVIHLPESTAAPGLVSERVTYTGPYSEPIWNFKFNPPTWGVDRPTIGDIEIDTVSKFTGRAPNKITPNLPSRPNPVPVTAPGDAPVVSEVIIPDAPILPNVSDPREWAIVLPVAPDINIEPFSATRPDGGSITKPSADFNWSEDPYTSETLDCVIARISDFCQGGVGIPDSVWEAIWAKENDRESRAGIKLIDEINEEWSDRGFQLPTGVQVSQTQEINQNLQHTAAGRSRDIAIREADLAIENLRFAVTQGIALESLQGSWYQATQQRLLEATRFASELVISVFNAEVSFYNAQVQMYLADVQVYRIELEAELTELEVYKSELEGQKIIGDLNMQQVQMYTARIQALNIEIEQYNAILQGVKLTTEVDAIRIDAYRAEVQAYGERINAINSEYNGYATAMQGGKIEADIYSTNVQAYGTKVQAYSAQVDASAKKANTEVAIKKLSLETYNSDIQAFLAEMQGAVAELNANTESFDAEVKLYLAEIDSLKVGLQAQTTNYQGALTQAQMITQTNIVNAQTNVQSAKAEADIVQKSLDSIAKVNGAYAGSALSAIHVGMSIGDSASNTASP